MAKTKIVVLKLKKLIYGAIIAALAILLLLLLITRILSDKNEEAAEETSALYRAGIYTSVIELNDTLLNLEVVLDKDHINSVRLINLDEATQTMYPLIEPAIEDISAQLASGKSLAEVTLSENSKYTQTLLLNSIRDTIAKAQLP